MKFDFEIEGTVVMVHGSFAVPTLRDDHRHSMDVQTSHSIAKFLFSDRHDHNIRNSVLYNSIFFLLSL